MCHTCSGFGKFCFKRFDVQFIVIANSGELVMDGGGGAGDFIKIKFCPMCGRSLTPLALDGGDSAASQAVSKPFIFSGLVALFKPTHRK
jgi:hypothetical protein